MGFAFDAGSGGNQLSAVFSALYVIGCLIAVLAVQQSGVFTAVIQPPLVLFVTVPSAYFLMHSSEIQGVKDVLINCGYPLIERFPLMFFTSAAVLLIGLARWYFGRSTAAATADESDSPAPAGRSGRLSATLSSLLGGAKERRDAATAARKPRDRRTTDRRRPATTKAAAARAARDDRSERRAATRSRHSRAPETEIIEPIADRPRRRRPRSEDEPRDAAAEPRRRPRPSSRDREPRERDLRDRNLRDRERRDREPLPPRERRSRYDREDRYERPRPSPTDRPPRRSRPDDYEPLDPYGSTGTSTHHPVSRVRYRGGEPDEQPEYRPRRRPQRDVDADRWEYDI